MKRWAIFTVFLYACALLLLTIPVILLAFGNWGLKDNGIKIADALAIYANWGYWLWLAILVAGQFLLLLVPIDLSERKLPARRKLKIPVIVTGFFLANLTFAGIFSILSTIFLDDAFDYLGIILICAVTIFWIIWAIIFHCATKSDAPDKLIKRAVRWLLRGSILELIIAVPSHVIVRRRDDCCAPAGTFWGIATGISVMLLCFGPGVYFLFVERCQKLKPKSAATGK